MIDSITASDHAYANEAESPDRPIHDPSIDPSGGDVALLRRCDQPRSRRAAAAAFHPLRDPFLKPRRRAAVRFLSDEAVRQLMLEHVREFGRHFRQSLHGNAEAAVVERSHPSRRAGDIGERLLRI